MKIRSVLESAKKKIKSAKHNMMRGQRRIRGWWTPPRMAAVAFVGLGLAGLIDGPVPYLIPWMQSLHQAISPELVGIGATILIVDAIYRYHENQVWKQTRKMAIAKLMRSLHDFLYGYLSSFTQPGDGVILFYDIIRVDASEGLLNLNPQGRELFTIDLFGEIFEREFEEIFGKPVESEGDPWKFDPNPIDELQRTIANILTLPPQAIDIDLDKHKLIAALFVIDKEIDVTRELLKAKNSKTNASDLVKIILKWTLAIYQDLRKEADHEITEKQWEDYLINSTEKLIPDLNISLKKRYELLEQLKEYEKQQTQ